jgi:hypothetical protein
MTVPPQAGCVSRLIEQETAFYAQSIEVKISYRSFSLLRKENRVPLRTRAAPV